MRNRAHESYVPAMRERTTDLLREVAAKINPSETLEIGTSLGVSGLTVLDAANGRLTTVEIDGEVLERARENFEQCGFSDRVTFVNDDCFAAVGYLSENEYDLVVLDGPKGHYDELYRLIKPLLKRGGALFCDDVDFHGLTDGKEYPDHKHRTIVYGLRRFIEDISSDGDFSVERYEIEDGVLIAYKIR